MAVPVTKSEAGLARKTAMPAMSSIVPQRSAGVRWSTRSCRPGISCRARRVSAVSIQPGRPALTWMLSRAHAEAHARVNCTIPPSDPAQAGASPARGTGPSGAGSFTASLAFASSRAAMTTRAPARASPRAMPSPMPPLPPVTTATFPLRSNTLSSRDGERDVILLRPRLRESAGGPPQNGAGAGRVREEGSLGIPERRLRHAEALRQVNDAPFCDQVLVEGDRLQHFHVQVDGAVRNTGVEHGVDGASRHRVEHRGREPAVHAAQRVEVAAVGSGPERDVPPADVAASHRKRLRRGWLRRLAIGHVLPDLAPRHVR